MTRVPKTGARVGIAEILSHETLGCKAGEGLQARLAETPALFLTGFPKPENQRAYARGLLPCFSRVFPKPESHRAYARGFFHSGRSTTGR